MDRFECDGKIILRLSCTSRTLKLEMVHSYHAPYINIGLTLAIQKFIDARIIDLTPSMITCDLAASGLQGIECVAQHQVYYRWQQKKRVTLAA